MSEPKNTDLVVLGGGPGGYTAAFRAADLGLSVTLIEKEPVLGGVCLNVGCIPSKALLHAASVIEDVKKMSRRGVEYSPPKIDPALLRGSTEGIIKKLTDGLSSLVKARNITVLRGTGRLLDRGTLALEGPGEETRIGFKNLIIAAGSSPVKLPVFPEDPGIWDSSDALALREIPERLLVVGGGIIGLEMATVYSALGSSVTVAELSDQLIPAADSDLVRPLFIRMKKELSEILLGTKATGAVKKGGVFTVTMEGASGAALTRDFDRILVAVGRVPNSRAISAERAGINLDERGFIVVNDRMETSVPGIFAVGDITGNPMLAHKAVRQGKVAAEAAAGLKAAFDPAAIPSVAYTSPEIAWAGLTEKEAKGSGRAYDKGVFPWAASGRALTGDNASGLTKILFDPDTKRIIGAGIAGHNAGELISEAVLAMEMGSDAFDIGDTVHPHPTLAETIGFASEIVSGTVTDLLPKK